MYRKTGDQYFDSKEFRNLLSQYETSVKTAFPIFMDVDDLTDIADYFHYIGQESEADVLIDKILELHPNAMGPIIYKVHQALENDDSNKAREIADQIIDKDSIDYLLLVGEILLAEQKIQQAEKLFSNNLSRIEADEVNDYVFDVANLFVDYSQFDKAMIWVMRCEKRKSPEQMELVARILFGLGNYPESERIFNELIDTDPYSVSYWNSLANAQYMQKKYNEAITSSEFAMAISPEDADGLLMKANCLCQIGEHQEAEILYQRYLKNHPDDLQAQLTYGTCLILLGKKGEGIAMLENVQEKLPKDSPLLTECYEELAFAYSDLHMPENALFYLDKTDELDCDHIDMKVIKGHILLANKRVKEAQNLFQEAVLESKNDPKVILRVIISAYDNHYLNATYNMLYSFLSTYGDKVVDGYAYMALCCWDLKKYDECLAYLKKAIAVNPNEVRQVLSDLFPPELDLKDYRTYLLDKIKELKS